MKKMMRRMTMGLAVVAGLVMTGCGGAEEQMPPAAQEGGKAGAEAGQSGQTESRPYMPMQVGVCQMFKGTGTDGRTIHSFQQCGYSGSWVPTSNTLWPGYQQPMVDGTLPAGFWASINNSYATTSSAAVRNAFISGTSAWGGCGGCVQ